ncbi:cupin domain-containing protein [Pseudoroseicyclus aestuarii]|uniref:Putative cupin superfamily protein n=1 Tax=Pseudoroseicyclus aestuarii TaxID=1795041 RepID=A0A318SSB8_9RHOB|nr:cupin domain-containing protein [Pseudoroseicyclus aestuarii]PYE81266.1 putative cupin superfamily protein [Pseudoroseicyclus aestuarii]
MTIIRKTEVPETEGISAYPGPYTLGRGRQFYREVSDAGGLTQFGAMVERLVPGGRSSQTHWESHEDEFLYMIEGSLTVIEGEEESLIGPGDCCVWKAGTPVGHALRNDSEADCLYLVVGSRNPENTTTYPGIDLLHPPQGYTHADGTPWTQTD